ncbi:Trimeric GatFAB AmidoTransferase(AdT) complex subunit [Puccinia graminis f. sp. tritici]|uniref:Glutamyl-tRNA(Gln) amidotransferase subunit A, mitochondrial n=1 Tax=Puccinia graminis f. sp. tritici TaxID=56615 RepID=A0A5B0QUE1_PUCGR|nr:Trimeric GatFAB AmidoTransferase(AdT) complex subunit [Puccinia graminis f. sp. tritici]KAA1116901.1 Trimeric GatFAB AmidoTransferase(AdT) complex subunit [Puccinia graminis f. sp. tritici]
MGTKTLVRKALISRSSPRLKNCFGTKPAVIPEGIEQASNAFITRLPPSASDLVEKPEPELAGLTVAIKDIFCTRGSVTSCASAALREFKPPYDAHVVSQLRRHGARIVGKTNMDEFSMGSASTFSSHGRVVNPHGFCPSRKTMLESRSAGGSSGGSAAAVAAGLCDIAIGSDTGGSIRLPAAHCGLIGLKPSYGLISRLGMVQYSTSLDTVGILARSTDQIRKTFSCLNGHDQRDPTSIPKKYRLNSNELNRLWQARFARESGDLSDIRVGVPIEYFNSDVSEDILSAFRATVDFLKQRGAQLVSISLPSTSSCLGAYYVIASAEASSNLARYSGLHYGRRSVVDCPARSQTASVPRHLYSATRTEFFGDEVKRRLLLGAYTLSASGIKNYFIQAQKVRLKVRAEFERTFRMPSALSTGEMSISPIGVDFLLTPATLSIAPRLDDSEQNVESWSQDQLLVPASLAGLPAMVVPVKCPKPTAAKPWPVGVQIIGQWGAEPMLFHLGSELEQIRP